MKKLILLTFLISSWLHSFCQKPGDIVVYGAAVTEYYLDTDLDSDKEVLIENKITPAQEFVINYGSNYIYFEGFPKYLQPSYFYDVIESSDSVQHFYFMRPSNYTNNMDSPMKMTLKMRPNNKILITFRLGIPESEWFEKCYILENCGSGTYIK